MGEARIRLMEITGLIWSNEGFRIEVTDLDTGEKFRWLPTDLIKALAGLRWEGEWTTYRRGGVDIAKLEN